MGRVGGGTGGEWSGLGFGKMLYTEKKFLLLVKKITMKQLKANLLRMSVSSVQNAIFFRVFGAFCTLDITKLMKRGKELGGYGLGLDCVGNQFADGTRKIP